MNDNVSQQQATVRITLQTHKVKTMDRIEAVTIVDFLAMCGGVLGLFIGFSALSSIELIYYPTLRLFCMVRRMNAENDEEQPEDGESSDDSSDDSSETPTDDETRENSVSHGNTVVQAT